MARATSLSGSWLPAYAWWPPSERFSLHAFLTPYHHAVEPDAEYEFHLRCYVDGNIPVWEHDAGRVRLGEQLSLSLDELGAPDPPAPHGGILEVHAIRLDKLPKKGTGSIGMLIDAVGPDGGYLIPTVPIRGAAKALSRDDVQVVPGIRVSHDLDTELVILNPIDEPTTVRTTVSSPDGVTLEGAAIDIAPWGAWQGSLKGLAPRARKLLEPSAGIGSLSLRSTHRMLPYFAFRREGGPLTMLDHAAPIFAPVQIKSRIDQPFAAA